MNVQPGTIHSVADRPPRTITEEEIGLQYGPLARINIGKPIMTTLGPITASLVSTILGKGLVKGTPVKLRDLPIKMKGGATTVADVYFPRRVYTGRLKAPTILIRTPYWKDALAVIADYFTMKGYVVVYHDIRGTGHSTRTSINSFTILEHDDGLRVIDWIKSKFWFNGKIGTWGASYLGMTQNAVADSPDITCFNVQVSSPRNLWMLHQGLGINELSVAIGRIQCDGAWFYDQPSQPALRAMPYYQYMQHFNHDPAANMYNQAIGVEKISMRDFSQLSTRDIVGMLRGVYGVDLLSSTPDPKAYQKFVVGMLFGDKLDRFHDFMPGTIHFDFRNIKAPNLIIAGWYDMFSLISIKDFCEIQASASEHARKYTKIIIGPWAHGEARHPDIKNAMHGGMLDFLANVINIDWFEYWLKPDHPDRERIARELIDMPPIRLFVMGKNEWRWEREWPLARTRYENLYLHSSGKANSKRGDGRAGFDAPAVAEDPDTYIHDPANPVMGIGGNNLNIPKGAFEQSRIENRDDVLVYTSERLETGIEITGPIKCILHAASTAVDTDFMVRLCDVYPNGKSFNISDLGVRARYRDGVLNPPSLIEPGKAYRYEIELWPTSLYVKPGHRLRVVVSSSDFPKYSVHSNLANGKKGEYTVARQTIFHDKDKPSCLVLPVIPKDA